MMFASVMGAMVLDEDTSEINPDDFDFFEHNNPDILDVNVSSLDKRVLEKYPNIKKLIIEKFYQFNEQLLKKCGDFDISTSWITKLKKGTRTVVHDHRNCFYSGLLYFSDYTDKSSTLSLRNPLSQLEKFYIENEEDTPINFQEWAIQPQKNLLIFFPSYIMHKPNENMTDDIRYSLAFNFVPTGFYGGGDSSNDTSWYNK